jgi:hypothetical protein
VNWNELFEWKERHPGVQLRACARFNEQVHLTRFINRAWVETFCGKNGPTKLNALVFKLPKESVDCKKCLGLAGLKEGGHSDGVQQGMEAALR